MRFIKLHPYEAKEIHSNKYVLRWLNKVEHYKGNPAIREYEILGDR